MLTFIVLRIIPQGLANTRIIIKTNEDMKKLKKWWSNPRYRTRIIWATLALLLIGLAVLNYLYNELYINNAER